MEYLFYLLSNFLGGIKMKVKELDKKLIEIANSNSFNGNRGDLREISYKNDVSMIMNWDISDNKRQTILDKLYDKNMEILKYEAQFISIMVAGPAKYNSKKFDKSDKILELSHDLCEWLENLKKQIDDFKKDDNGDETKEILSGIKRLMELNLDPTKDIMKLAFVDNTSFIKTYEEYNKIFKWRKNSNIYKLYQNSLKGEVKEIKKEIFFEDENLTAFIEGDRAYIKFIMKPQRQLIVALKSRKWWWNSYKNAWSTYLYKLDKEWVSKISERYAKYI